MGAFARPASITEMMVKQDKQAAQDLIGQDLTDSVEHADRKIARAAGKERGSKAVRMLGKASELADQPPLIALSAATIAAGLVLRRGRLARTGVRMLASHWLATSAKSFLKHRIDRTRPFVMLGGGSYHAHEGHSQNKRETSFPSGHTAGAVAVSEAIAREYPGAKPVVRTLAALAGGIQIPRAAHFLSDVLVGAAIGFVAEAIVAKLLPKGPARPR